MDESTAPNFVRKITKKTAETADNKTGTITGYWNAKRGNRSGCPRFFDMREGE
jgi:hypothetical protein